MSNYNPIEPVDELVQDKKKVDEYRAKLIETNGLVKRLENVISELQEELFEERQNSKKLNKQLDDYAQTAAANISKRTLNYYVESILERSLTEKEWLQFIKTFSYDSSDLDKKVYDWIIQNLVSTT
jgi:hypothetical protein